MDVGREQELLDWLGSSCWFCGERPPVHGISRVVKLIKGTAGASGGTSIIHSAVAVPRCAECLAGHGLVNRIAFAACAGGALAAFLIFVVWSPIDFAGWLKAVLVLLAAGPGGMLMAGTLGLPEGQKPETAAATYTGVEAMKRGGWGIDDALLRPPGGGS